MGGIGKLYEWALGKANWCEQNMRVNWIHAIGLKKKIHSYYLIPLPCSLLKITQIMPVENAWAECWWHQRCELNAWKNNYMAILPQCAKYADPHF